MIVELGGGKVLRVGAVRQLVDIVGCFLQQKDSPQAIGGSLRFGDHLGRIGQDVFSEKFRLRQARCRKLPLVFLKIPIDKPKRHGVVQLFIVGLGRPGHAFSLRYSQWAAPTSSQGWHHASASGWRRAAQGVKGASPLARAVVTENFADGNSFCKHGCRACFTSDLMISNA